MAGERILILEDNQTLREEMTRILTDEGYVVEGSGSFEKAVALAQTRPFDLLVADVYLPERTGIEAFQEIRAFQPDLAGVVITAYSTWEVTMNALRAGFSGFLVKPFGPEELVSALVAALEQEKLRRENARLRALVPLYELADAFMNATELPELLKQIVAVTREETRAEVVSLMLLDESRQKLAIAASDGLPTEILRSHRGGIVGEGIAGWVAKNGKALIIAEGVPLDTDVRRAMREPNVVSALCLPLLARGDVIGVLNVSRLRGAEHFTRGDLELAAVLASQAAIAIEKARLINDLRVLSETSQRLATASDLNEAAAVLTEAPSLLLGATRSALWLWNANETKPVRLETFNFGESELKNAQPPDSETTEGFRAQGTGGVFALAITRGTRKFGILESYLSGAYPPHPDRIDLLRALAQTAATVIEAHELRAREMSALRELDSALRMDLNLQTILNRVLNEMVLACAADGGAVYLVDSNGKPGDSVAHTGLNPRRKLVSAMLRAEKPSLFTTEQLGRSKNIRAAIGAPLTVGGKLEGWVVLVRRDPQTFSSRHLNLLSVLSATAALVVRNAQLYARSEEAAIAEERGRLAREMHDGLVQDLSSSVLRLEAIRKRLPVRIQKMGEELRDIAAVLRGDVREVRRTIFALRPLDLEMLGFLPALEKFIQDFGRVNEIEIAYKIKGDTNRISPKLEIAILRLLQESLNNARKHAHAKHVWIDLTVADKDNVELQVRDDGSGFEIEPALEAARKRGSLGLVQMRERAERAGGTFQLDTKPGKGSRIRVTLPLR